MVLRLFSRLFEGKYDRLARELPISMDEVMLDVEVRNTLEQVHDSQSR
jgi:hypothetical protein